MRNLARTSESALVMLLAMALPCLTGTACRGKDKERAAHSKSAGARQATARPATGFTGSPSAVSPEGEQREVQNDGFGALNDADLHQRCLSIIGTKSITPESRNAEELETMLSLLLARKSPLFFEAIGALPPGYYSEALVKKAFLKMRFKSLDEALKLLAPIQQSDLHRAGLDGAASSVAGSIRNGEARLGVNSASLVELRKSGLSVQYFAVLMVAGAGTGEVSVSDIPASVSPHDNLLMMQAAHYLSPALGRSLVEDALSQNAPVDVASIGVVASRSVQEDPAVAMAWASKLPGKFSPVAIRSALAEWLAADPMAASAYVGTMGEGAAKDASIQSIVKDCVNNGNFEDAGKWTEAISGEEVKSAARKLITDGKAKSQR